MPLLRNLDKSKISKRKNPVSLIYYRQAGFLPEAVINFLGLMGGGMPAPNTEGASTDAAKPASGTTTKSSETDIFTLSDMVARFDVKNIRLGGPVFDLTKLKWLNGEYIRALTPESFYKALRETILSDAYLQQIAPLVQTRIETLGEFGNLHAPTRDPHRQHHVPPTPRKHGSLRQIPHPRPRPPIPRNPKETSQHKKIEGQLSRPAKRRKVSQPA